MTVGSHRETPPSHHQPKLATPKLTILHLQQGFGQNAPGHAYGLADVVPRVFGTHVGDGQLAAQGDGEAAGL